MIASLPMYAGPGETAAIFWATIRRRLVARGVTDAPERLSDPQDLSAHWRSPHLLFSQTCGLPFSTELAGDVTLLAVPHYAAPGCEGASYRSVILARAGDRSRTLAALVGRRAAVNSFDSHSGFTQLVVALAPFAQVTDLFSELLVTGSHQRSLTAVRTGMADFAAIDCVTLALLAAHEPEAVSGLRVVGRSPPSLGLPFVASSRLPNRIVNALRDVLVEVMEDATLEHVRRPLLLRGFSVPAANAYAGHAEAAGVVIELMARRGVASQTDPRPTAGPEPRAQN